MKAPVIDTTGKNTGTIELPKSLFGVTPNEQILAQYVRVYLHRQRQSSAKVKNRAEVTGTTAKVWRQKGTGRARHGSRKAPIFVKGGKAHAPNGEQHYALKMSKALRRNALLSALSLQAKNVSVIEGLDTLSAKTKDFAEMAHNISDAKVVKGLVLVLDTSMDALNKASSNVSGVQLTQAKRLNAYEVINAKKIFITKESLTQLETLVSTNESSKATGDKS